MGYSFVSWRNLIFMVGDNIFFVGKGFLWALAGFKREVTVFTYQMNDPGRHDIVDFDRMSRLISLEEKSEALKNNYALLGADFYKNQVVCMAKNAKQSSRGKLEIANINL